MCVFVCVCVCTCPCVNGFVALRNVCMAGDCFVRVTKETGIILPTSPAAAEFCTSMGPTASKIKSCWRARLQVFVSRLATKARPDTTPRTTRVLKEAPWNQRRPHVEMCIYTYIYIYIYMFE